MLSLVEFQDVDADVASADCSTTETCVCFSSGTLRSCLPSLTVFWSVKVTPGISTRSVVTFKCKNIELALSFLPVSTGDVNL